MNEAGAFLVNAPKQTNKQKTEVERESLARGKTEKQSRDIKKKEKQRTKGRKGKK